MSIRATSRLWRRPWAQTIRQRALRSPPRTLAQDPYAFFTKRPRLPAQGCDRTIARLRDAPASRTACPRRRHELNRQREHTVESLWTPALISSTAPEGRTWTGSMRPLASGLQYGCRMRRLDCSILHHVLPANRDKTKSRRADSNRLPLLITSDRSGVAGVCRGLQIRISKRHSLLWVAACCTAFRSQ